MTSGCIQAIAQTSNSDPNDELLARAVKRYYSAPVDGLKGFDCEMHADWHTLIVSANPGQTIDSDDPRLVLLNAVTVIMHARLDGSSSIDWTPGPVEPSTADLADMMKTVESGTKQTLMGFIQFWTPFIDGSIIPTKADGVTVTRNDDGGYTLQASDKEATVTEILDSDLVLRHYDVIMGASKVNFVPTYSPSAKGLLVTYFLAHMKENDNAPEQELHVGVIYGELDGKTIPIRLDMEVVGTGVFHFTFDNCRVNP